MALSRNFFELFDLPQQFGVDQSDLARRYRTLQGQLHPDRYAQAGAAERRMAAQNASFVNEAFQTLKDPQRRAEYLLSLREISCGTGESETTADTDFLMKQMEWREELDSAAGSENALEELSHLARKLRAEQKQLERDFDEYYRSDRLAEARAVTQNMQFFRRLIEQADRNLESLEDN